MLVLKATTEQIQVVLAGAITTSQLDCFACFRDIAAATYAAGSNATATDGVTDVNLVPAPAPLTQRVIDYLSVYNNDTAPATVTIKQDNGGVERILWRGALGASEGLTYTDGTGWSKLNTGGVPVAGGSGGNPTALVGTVAINGVASTFLRSDAAPALNQAIAPVWTGAHSFAGILPVAAPLGVQAVQIGATAVGGKILFIAPTAPLNGKVWSWSSGPAGISLSNVDDVGATSSLAYQALHTGMVITGISYGNATDNPTHTFFGPVTHNGAGIFRGAQPAGPPTAPSQVSIGLLAAGLYPSLIWSTQGAPVNARVWRLYTDETDGGWRLQSVNDAGAVIADAITITRTGAGLTSFVIGGGANVRISQPTAGDALTVSGTVTALAVNVFAPVAQSAILRVSANNLGIGGAFLSQDAAGVAYLGTTNNGALQIITNNVARASFGTDGTLNLLGHVGLLNIGSFGYTANETWDWAIGPGTQSANNGVPKMWRLRAESNVNAGAGSTFSIAAYEGFDASGPGNYLPTNSFRDFLSIQRTAMVYGNAVDLPTHTFNGVLTYAADGIAQEVGFRSIRWNDVGGNYSTIAADDGRGLRLVGGSGFTVTLAAGSLITIINESTATMGINTNGALIHWFTGSGIVSAAGSRFLAPGGVATAVAYDGVSWRLWGMGIS